MTQASDPHDNNALIPYQESAAPARKIDIRREALRVTLTVLLLMTLFKLDGLLGAAALQPWLRVPADLVGIACGIAFYALVWRWRVMRSERALAMTVVMLGILLGLLAALFPAGRFFGVYLYMLLPPALSVLLGALLIGVFALLWRWRLRLPLLALQGWLFSLLFTAAFYFVGFSSAPTAGDFMWFRQGLLDALQADEQTVLLLRDVGWWPVSPDDVPPDSLLIVRCNALALGCVAQQRVYSDFEQRAVLRRDTDAVLLLLDGREAARLPLP
jgi:hypothetical protein